MSADNLIAASLNATPAEIAAHWDRINPETVRWMRLEMSRRFAVTLTNTLAQDLRDGAHEYTTETYAVWAAIADVAAQFADELERAKDSRPLGIRDAEKLMGLLEQAIDQRSVLVRTIAPRLRQIDRDKVPTNTDREELAFFVLNRAIDHLIATVKNFIDEQDEQEQQA